MPIESLSNTIFDFGQGPQDDSLSDNVFGYQEPRDLPTVETDWVKLFPLIDILSLARLKH